MRTPGPSHLTKTPRVPAPRTPTRRYTARLPTWLFDALGAQAAKNRVATNALLIEYLGRAVDPMNADIRDAAIAERLRAIEEHIRPLEAVIWRQRVTLEAIGVLAKTVLSYMREATTRDERVAAHAQGERRFPAYTKRVAEWTDGREKGFAAVLEEEFDRAEATADRPGLSASAGAEVSS
jgi:hypothetical protein